VTDSKTKRPTLPFDPFAMARSAGDLAWGLAAKPAELLEVLRRFGADPVDMPMGEVYSALAKGVLDGVIAPADTLRSLHFAEVARYFNTLSVPRGAYAARAIGMQRWNSLDAEQRAILEESIGVWEQALDRELRQAQIAG